MAEELDDDRDRTAFERMMRRLFANAEVKPLNEPADASSFDSSRRLLMEAGSRLEDCRPEGGILETASTIYKVLEPHVYGDSFVGDIGIVGAEAFAKNKHLCIHAVALPSDALWRMRNLGLSEYFQFKQLRVVYAVSEMQVHRSIASLEATHPSPASKPTIEANYWALALRSFAWIVVAVCAYYVIRARPGYALWSLVAILPFWIKAFYGVRLQATRTFSLRSPADRFVRANDFVAFVAAIAIAISATVFPPFIPFVALTAVLTDVVCFFSPRVTSMIVARTAWLPRALR